MSVASLGASSSAYSYLQSLLGQQPGNGQSDPTQRLLAAFYPSITEQPATPDGAAGCADCAGPVNKAWTAGSGAASGTSATGGSAGATGSASATGGASGGSDPTSTSSPASGAVGFSPETLAALISIQGDQGGEDRGIAARAQHVFAEFDANGDGSISKSEFEAGFGANADLSKVDGLFNVLDADGDGSISLQELTSAAEQSRAQHHHHHHHASGGDGDQGGGGLGALLSATDLTGATSKTTSNPDGSTSTTITFADGSTVTATTPASGGAGASGGNADGASSGGLSGNLLQQFIEREAQLIAAQASQTLANI